MEISLFPPGTLFYSLDLRIKKLRLGSLLVLLNLNTVLSPRGAVIFAALGISELRWDFLNRNFLSFYEHRFIQIPQLEHAPEMQ